MTTLQNRAAVIAVRVTGVTGVTTGAAIDPLTLLAIVGLLVDVVRAIYRCRRDDESAAAVARDPSWVSRLTLRMLARRHLRSHPGLAGQVDQVADAIEEEGRSVTGRDMAGLHAEALKYGEVTKDESE